MTSPPQSHQLEPGHAPTPFSAAQIRAACPPGRTMRLLVESAEGESFIRVNRFLEGDEEGATQESGRLSLDGTPLEPVDQFRVTWLGLQRHASFPQEQTSIDEETIDTPMGPLRCMRYTVTEGDRLDTFWFAHDYPGMPVRYSNQKDSRVTNLVTMQSSVVSAGAG